LRLPWSDFQTERLRRTIINAEYKALGTAHAPQRNAGAWAVRGTGHYVWRAL